MEVLYMSARDQLKLDIIGKVVTGVFDREKACLILDVSERTIRRYLKAYMDKGPLFVKHGNYQRPAINKTSKELKDKVLCLVREKYFDFNMLHCLEKLAEYENIHLKRETFRKWCHEIKMVKRAKRRRSKARYMRTRMKQTGIMIQMDGSPHKWFGNKDSCLISSIDDASNEIPFAEFFPSEDTISCMRVLQNIVAKKGIFQILYVDRAGWFGGTKRTDFAQVKRACEELGIHVIFANSAEAKGRIERHFQTMQDRLIPEMRLRRIHSYQAANCFLQDQFLPNEYGKKFTVTPANLQTAYKPLPEGTDLNQIFCLKDYRIIKRDHTVGWQGKLYQIESPVKYSIYKQKIEIRTYQDLTFKMFFAGKELPIKLVNHLRMAA
jgi:transposase